MCEVIAGQSPDGQSYNATSEGMPFYQGKKAFGARHIGTPTAWTTQPTKVTQDGDILMSVRAPVGPVNLAIAEACIGRGLAAIRPHADLDRDFLFCQLVHLEPDIAGTEGAVFPPISRTEIESLAIAFAPLPEQQRIVGILEEALTAMSTARENAEKNLRNARSVFESHLQAVFKRSGDGFTAPIGDDADVFDGPHATPKTVESGPVFLGISALHDGVINLGETRHVTPDDFLRWTRRVRPQSDDIVFSYETRPGQAAIIP